MIISQQLAHQARRTWSQANLLGKQILCCESTPTDTRSKTIIGIVGDVHTRGPAHDLAPEFYLPIDQAPADTWTWTQRTMTLIARGPDPRTLATATRATVAAVDPTLPLTLTTMDDSLRGATAEERFHTLLLLALGLLGLFLAAVGIYGDIAHFAGLRTREIASA